MDETTAPTVTARRAERHAAIVATAARLFAREGYANCEMELVTSELGIAKGTLYLYFKSKEELFYACVDAGMLQLQTAVQVAAEEVTEPFERISAAVRAYFRYFEEHPEQAELMIQERAYFRDRQQPTYFVHRESSRARWREIYSKLIAEGRIRGDLTVEQVLDTVGNLVYGAMFTSHFLGRSAQEQHAVIMDVLWRGIWSDQERANHPPRA
ncbi:MAG TPA: TetR/AcrR family transcriptional regulator [Pirellulaceae bacterium]|nr:TetR/AcrR family transcriptional regulator [Pirellulaceae bacterium]